MSRNGSFPKAKGWSFAPRIAPQRGLFPSTSSGHVEVTACTSTWNPHRQSAYERTGKDDVACGAGGAGPPDGAAGGFAVGGGMELARESFRVRLCPVLRDWDGVCAGREEDGRVVVQAGRRCGTGGGVCLWLVNHGPNGGLGASGAPVVSQRACSGDRWGLAGAAARARVGSNVVRNDGDACPDSFDPAFRRAAGLCAKNRHRAWCLRGVVRRLGSAVPAREPGGIEVRPRPIPAVIRSKLVSK